MRLTTSFRQFVSYSAVITLAIVTAFSIYIGQAGAASNDEAHNGRLITFHDRGEKRVILTHAQNVRDALKDADITVVEEDIVEPSLGEPLVAADYTVNIYRARPVIVVDGMVRQKVMTAAQTVEGISDAAGVELHDADRGIISASMDILSDGAGIIMTVDRATKFTLNLYGTKTTAYSQAKTVGEMLGEKNIQLGPNDDVSVDANTPLTAGLTVSIWRDGVQTTTVEEKIAFTVRQIQDADRPAGYHKIEKPGVDGRKMVTYQVVMKNGKVVKKIAIQTVVIEKPKEQVEIVGVSLPPGSHQDWMAAAGIKPSDFGFVNYIVNHENRSWNPCRVQGAGMIIDCAYPGTAMRGYGLVQATPGKKMESAGSDWRTNPITQLKWADSYAVGRYGSWQAAYEFKLANGWW